MTTPDPIDWTPRAQPLGAPAAPLPPPQQQWYPQPQQPYYPPQIVLAKQPFSAYAGAALGISIVGTVIALVTGVALAVLPLAGVVLGHWAAYDARANGKGGRGVAIAAAIIGWAAIVIFGYIVLKQAYLGRPIPWMPE